MIAELVSTAATALVGAMAGDTWDQVKKRFLQLFGRTSAPLDVMTSRLDASKAEVDVLLADQQAVDAVAALWRLRISDLLEEHPELVDELRQIVRDIQRSAPSAQEVPGAIIQQIKAEGSAQQAVQGSGSQVNQFGSQHGS